MTAFLRDCITMAIQCSLSTNLHLTLSASIIACAEDGFEPFQQKKVKSTNKAGLVLLVLA